jgi:PIN domain nuclease of toxin-antitoxin system
MVFIDTHIALWLYNGDMERLSLKGKKTLDTNDIHISPICKLELEYLLEIGKIKKGPADILGVLADSIDLKIDDISMGDIIDEAIAEKWTRDPFDRLIVAHAKKRNAILVSADRTIAKHYKKTLI